MACIGPDESSSDEDIPLTNVRYTLKLYYHHFSYPSQKVIMALEEKDLLYEIYLVDIRRGVQFEPWFLQLNPQAELPVLVVRDNSGPNFQRVIPGYARIIPYLDDLFYMGPRPLLPLIPQLRGRAVALRDLVDSVSSEIITMGSVFHAEMFVNPQTPVIPPFRQFLAEIEIESSDLIRQSVLKNDQWRGILRERANLQYENHRIAHNQEEFIQVLELMDSVLDQIEEELSTHTDEQAHWWLCADTFTAADISLTVLLERLFQLGLDSRCWLLGRRPNIVIYYEKVKFRESHRMTFHSDVFGSSSIMDDYNSPRASRIKTAVAVFAVVSVIVGGFFLVRKLGF